jgi:hypothetical protein
MSSASPAVACRTHRSRTPKTAVATPPAAAPGRQAAEPLDVGLARATYLEALAPAQFAGRFAVDGNVVEVAHAA